MYPSDLLHDVIRYGLVVSALLLALVCFGYGRGGAGRGYLWFASAAGFDALRHLLVLFVPAGQMLVFYAEFDLLLRSFLLLTGVRLLTGASIPGVLRWLPFLALAWLAFCHLAYSEATVCRQLPGTILLASAYVLLAMFFWRARDQKRPAGFLLAGFGFLALSLLWLVQPLARESSWSAWHFASYQVLYLQISAGLILALYQSERLRADFASEVQERALMRVLRSRRRVVQLREWTDVLLHQISDGVVVSDMNGTITGFNRGAEKIFGQPASNILGKPVTELMPDSARPETGQLSATLNGFRERFRQPKEVVGRHMDGSPLELEMVVSPMAISDAEQMVAIIRDVSERKRQREQLHFMARHDALTGLPNRRCFEELVAQRLGGGQSGLLAFVDLDDFKLINDTLGHKAGDTALVAIARRLVSLAGDQAVVARQSGDEFVLFIPAMTDYPAMREWAEELVQRVRSPVSFDQVQFGLSCSVGLAPTSAEVDEVETLVREADLAMYHAKRSGKNRFSFFHRSMLAESNRIAELAGRLKRMDMDSELSLVFQPRMQLEAGSCPVRRCCCAGARRRAKIFHRHNLFRWRKRPVRFCVWATGCWRKPVAILPAGDICATLWCCRSIYLRVSCLMNSWWIVSRKFAPVTDWRRLSSSSRLPKARRCRIPITPCACWVVCAPVVMVCRWMISVPVFHRCRTCASCRWTPSRLISRLFIIWSRIVSSGCWWRGLSS